MSNFKLEARKVLDAARGNWDRIYTALAPDLGLAVAKWGHHVPCPVHGGTDGFRLVSKHGHPLDDGQGICNTCSEFVRNGKRTFLTGVSILMWVGNLSPRDYPKLLEDIASVVAPHLLDDRRNSSRPRVVEHVKRGPSQEEIEAAKVRDRDKLAKMRAVWNSGYPISSRESALAHRYFKSRGLPIPTAQDGLDSDIRFVPMLDYYHKEFNKETGEEVEERGRYPAIVALLRNVKGQAVALHRIYLAHNGSGKAPVTKPKKLMGKPDAVSINGALIRLGKVGKVLCLAEGVETARAVSAFTGFPCWATYAAPLMMVAEIPAGVEGVYIFGDKDRSNAGQEAMNILKEKLEGLGYTVYAELPPGEIPIGQKSLDWLDVFEQQGERAIWAVQSMRRFLTKEKVITLGNAGRKAVA